jgi:uncharacterized SAM-binding protein YcdF (DUF218 family)
MKKTLLIASLSIGILFTLGATATTIAFGFTMGNVLALLVGICLIGLYFSYPKLPVLLRKITNTFLLCIAVFMLTMILFIGVNGTKNTATFEEDCVLVLGCGIRGETLLPTLEKRLNKCLEYLNHNPNALIIVSGGQGHNEIISEAEAMKRYLVAKGVKAAQIVKEDQSRNTAQNMQLSKQLADDYFLSRGKTNYTIVCITSNYHAYRAAVLAKKSALTISHYNAGTPWYLCPSAYCREVLSIVKMWILPTVNY